MGQKEKTWLIGGLLAIIVIMGVGYAAFSTLLNINGTAEITSNWDVHISNIEVAADNPVGTAASTANSVVDGNLAATFSSTLQAPGDSVTYDVTVVNEGSLPAKLSGINFTQTNTGEGATDGAETVENNGQSYTGDNAIVYSYSGITTDATLDAKNGEHSSVTFQVKVEYNSSLTKQPDTKQLKSDLKMVLTYVQDIKE